MKHGSLKWMVYLTFLMVACGQAKRDADPPHRLPNIVIIYMDDLGYGDLSCYGATEIRTPHIDALARRGVRFTDAHATSATCTPSRYGLLTGMYPWRNREARILSGTAPLIISPGQPTLPKMLKEKGYHTAIVGKWHLGLGTGVIDWNKKVAPGPNEVGFDYAFYLAATQDRVPTVYLENGYVVGLDPEDPVFVDYEKNFEGEPTGLDHPEMLTMKWHHGHNGSIVNGIPRIGFMKGGESARWNDTVMAGQFLQKTKEFVHQYKDESFFLYYAMQQPHVPRTPNPRFAGKSGMGPRGDVILEADWCVGQFVRLLKEEGLLENTLIIFSSDNGPVLNDGYFDDAVEKLGKHTPWGPLRGGKYSLYEAGTRVPMITCWEGTIEPNVSDALISQMDILASLAKLVGVEVEHTDSRELLDVLFGRSAEGRETLVPEATSRTAFRKGSWIMIPPHEGRPVSPNVNIELGNSPDYQLYNLEDDLGERTNMATSNPDLLNDLVKEYGEMVGMDRVPGERLELK